MQWSEMMKIDKLIYEEIEKVEEKQKHTYTTDVTRYSLEYSIFCNEIKCKNK